MRCFQSSFPASFVVILRSVGIVARHVLIVTDFRKPPIVADGTAVKMRFRCFPDHQKWIENLEVDRKSSYATSKPGACTPGRPRMWHRVQDPVYNFKKDDRNA